MAVAYEIVGQDIPLKAATDLSEKQWYILRISDDNRISQPLRDAPRMFESVGYRNVWRERKSPPAILLLLIQMEKALSQLRTAT